MNKYANKYAMGLQCGNIVALDTCGLRKQVDAAIKNTKVVKELDACALEVFKAWKKRNNPEGEN